MVRKGEASGPAHSQSRLHKFYCYFFLLSGFGCSIISYA